MESNDRCDSGIDQLAGHVVHNDEVIGSNPTPTTITLKDWQVPLAEHQTRVLKSERCMLSACHTGCLASGTPVRMFDGSVKPVEDIRPGDVIESFDEITSTIYPNEVLDIIRTCHKPKPMIQYTYENETIRTTYDHYFLVDDGFVPLYQLAWRAMEASQRVHLELLCKRYGTPLDLDAPWWKTSCDNKARKGRERILPHRLERENSESSPHSRRELAVEPVRSTVRESYRLQPREQPGREPGMVLGEVQCVVWRAPWEDQSSEAPATEPCAGDGEKGRCCKGERVPVACPERPTWSTGTDERSRVGKPVYKTDEDISGIGESQVPDHEKLGKWTKVSFTVKEAEPYFTISLRKAPYAYCIGRRNRFPVHNSGKTYIATQTIKDLGMQTLVVCPKIAISQWKNVIRGMGAEHLVKDVINPEQLVKKTGCYWYNHEDGWTLPPDITGGGLLVFDEVHRGASGKDSKTTLALARWCSKKMPEGNKVLAMSATPFETPLKLRALGYLMGFHRFVERDFYDWCRRHACSMVPVGRYPRIRQVFAFTTNKARAEEVMRIIRRDMGDRFLSVGPDEIPGFPEEVKEVCLVDLAKKDHDALVRAYEEMPERIRGGSEDDMVRILRLRQQAEFCKAEVMAEMAVDAEADGNSIFLCVNFTDARKRIEEYFRSKNVPFASIYGGQKESERQDGIDKFQRNEIHIIVGMAAACSVALSLHDERKERPRVSLISPGYSASEFAQSLGRVRRVGGTTAVQKIIIAAGSVEERVGRTIERKMNNLSALTDSDLSR